MARTNLNTVENTETLNAWEATGHKMGFYTVNGEIAARNGDRLFTIPTPADFDQVPESLRPFLTYSIAKHVEYRIAQNKGGDLNEAAAKFINELGSFEPVRDVNAADAVFLATVESALRDRIVDVNGEPAGERAKLADTWLVAARDDAGSTILRMVDKGTPDAFLFGKGVESHAKKEKQAGKFDRVIDEALERGRNKPVDEKVATKRGGRPARNLDFDVPI